MIQVNDLETNLETNCRFCSLVAKANGQDPIGSAGTFHHWLIVEIPPPWPTTIWQAHPIAAPVLQMVKALRQQGVYVRPLMIAPEREYSHPDLTRVLYYRRPQACFAAFEKQEFLLPPAEVVPLVTALLQQPDALPQFNTYLQPTQAIREIFVCTHGNVDVACSRFGYPIYRHLKEKYVGEWGSGRVGESKHEGVTPKPCRQAAPTPPLKIQNPKLKTSPTPLRVWRCSHFGGHNFAPTLIDLPTGQYWGHLDPDVLDTLVYRQGDVQHLRRFYRGWSGLRRFEQMVERELWMQHGWDWLSYRKVGQTLAIDTTQEDEYDADWAEVRIDFEAPEGHEAGAYAARVEVAGEVLTQWRSGEEHPLEPVKQYQVTQLRRVA